MWTHKLLSVLVLVSIGQTNCFYQKQISNGNDDDKSESEGLYVLQDADGARRAFVVKRESTPNSVRMDAGFQLFEIPIRPQSSYSREKDVSEVHPTQKAEPEKSGWKFFPLSRAFTGNNNQENGRDKVVKVLAGKLKQQQNVGILQAATDDSTFPWGLGARSAGAFSANRNRGDDDDDDSNLPWGLVARLERATSDDEIRRNDLATDKVAAGLQIFELPLGPQFSYNNNNVDDGSGDKNDALISLLTPLISNIAKRWIADYAWHKKVCRK